MSAVIIVSVSGFYIQYSDMVLLNYIGRRVLPMQLSSETDFSLMCQSGSKYNYNMLFFLISDVFCYLIG